MIGSLLRSWREFRCEQEWRKEREEMVTHEQTSLIGEIVDETRRKQSHYFCPKRGGKRVV